MEKLAVALWNYKGGVGKSTISLILSQEGARRGLRVLALDLDRQKNFSDALALSGSYFPTLDVSTELNPDVADQPFDFYVLDLHPEMGKTEQAALRFADIVLAPMYNDFFSAANIGPVWEQTIETGKDRQQAAIIKNCVESSRTSLEIENAVNEEEYPTAGRIPRNGNIVRNIALGRPWWSAMNARQQKPFIELYDHIWRAYTNMLAGNLTNPWR